MASRTTTIGYTNPFHQQVICDTGREGTDHCQHVVEMRCTDCGRRHGVNSSNCFQAKCINRGGVGPFCGQGQHEDLL